jgi:ubiquinone/menaquinone biosynthesis C-methylase UbiE
MDKLYAKYLLEKTREDYNRIAEDFSRTRSYLPEDIKLLGKYAQEGDRVLDLGCGNGRLIELFKDLRNIEYIGVDSSEKLVEIAKKNQGSRIKNQEFLTADALSLPFENNHFDKIYSIAVLHHVPSEELRLRFLDKAKRVLKPGGLLILTVWNLRYDKFWQILKFAVLKMLRRSKLDFKDVFIPWKNSKGEILARRYIHCFGKRELKNLAEKAGFQIEEIGTLSRLAGRNSNIYLIVKKI